MKSSSAAVSWGRSRAWRVSGLALGLLAWGALAAAPASAESKRRPRRPATPVAAEEAPAPAASTAPAATESPPIGAPAENGPVNGAVLGCVHPEESNAGVNIEVVCAPSSIVDVARMQVFYRAQGAEGFTKIAMDYSESSGHRAVIPGTAARGRAMQYYCEATNAAGVVVASDGREDSPNTVLLHGDVPVAGSEGPSEAAPIEGSGLVAAAEAGSDLDARPGSLWVGLAFGSAYGWQPSVSLERRKDLSAEAGFAGAGLGYFAPEIGYHVTRNVAVALRGRHQVLPAQGTDPAHPGSSARWAHSVLLRGIRTFSFDRTAVFVAGQVGGGQGMRFYFPARQDIGLMTSDTSQAGPLLLGPAVGFQYRLNAKLAVVAQLQAFFAAPQFAAFADTDLGMQVTF
jgi:hypothetical protein